MPPQKSKTFTAQPFSDSAPNRRTIHGSGIVEGGGIARLNAETRPSDAAAAATAKAFANSKKRCLGAR